MQTLNVGLIFDAGLAIVILAIVLDRTTEQASRRMDAREREADANSGRGLIPRRLVLIGLGLITVAALGATVVAPDWAGTFPEELAVLSFSEPVNDIVTWIKTNLVFLTTTFKDWFTAIVLNPIQDVLTSCAVLAGHWRWRGDRRGW